MELLEGLAGLRRLPPGAVMSIGNFDGMHRGHRRILDTARELCAGTAPLAVVTFEPHPLTVLRPEAAPPRLTPPPAKRRLIEAAGVDHLVVLPPAKEVLDLTAEGFWEILRDEVRPKDLVEGRDFTFGKGRGGTVESLRRWSEGTGTSVHVVEPLTTALLDLSVVPVSSSLIRWLLYHGRARDAAVCLGRPYALEGEVVKGYQRGRQIGVPTANLRPGDQLVPLDGVYAGRCEIDGTTYPAALSIGTMPTFGEHQRQIEAHLIGFDGNLYGRVIRVEVTDWLREQWKFHGVEALKEQIASDLQAVRSRMTMNAEVPIASAVG